jgi:hypothetical protein
MLEALPPTPIEPIDGEAISAPSDKERALAHYTAMALEALEDAPWCFETQIGRAVLRGDTDVSGALVALDAYEAWIDGGEPKTLRVFDSDMGSTDIMRAV